MAACSAQEDEHDDAEDASLNDLISGDDLQDTVRVFETGPGEMTIEEINELFEVPEPPLEFDHTRNETLIQEHLATGEPLIVHAYVPLCDNEHQGIVPTSESLGDGMNLSTNLYWATSYGMWKYFKNNANWEYVYNALVDDPDPDKPIHEDVLMRAIYKRTMDNGLIVYLICDAYRGDRMESCLNDYFSALGSLHHDTISITGDTIIGAGGAHLIAFNGHNGLMDTWPEFPQGVGPTKDAVAIACVSEDFFPKAYEYTRSFPLVMTTSLLYPGAEVMDQIIITWANGGTGEECRLAAGQGYKNMKDKYSLESCQRMFSSGW